MPLRHAADAERAVYHDIVATMAMFDTSLLYTPPLRYAMAIYR